MSALEGFKADVDTRLFTLWAELWNPAVDALFDEHEGLREMFAAAIRAAYTIGYSHALREDGLGRRGELFTTHGYGTY